MALPLNYQPRVRDQFGVLDFGRSRGRGDVLRVASQLEEWFSAMGEWRRRPQVAIWTSTWQVYSEGVTQDWKHVYDFLRPVAELQEALKARRMAYQTRCVSRRKRDEIDLQANLSGRGVAYL